jgi:hypothetical protein
VSLRRNNTTREARINSWKQLPWPPVAVFILVLVPAIAFDQRYRFIPLVTTYAFSILSFALVVLAVIARMRKSEWLERLAIGLLCLTLITLNADILKALIVQIFSPGSMDAVRVMGSALLIWYANVVLFSLAYWEIDRGGPVMRAQGKKEPLDLLFPEMTFEPGDPEQWKPNFGDYLYVAFNISTAFSATDVATASTRVRLLVVVQAAISLAAVVIVAARAINIAPASP